ncbi:CRTAC1 family protein [Paenibacillus sp. SYP-B4298]|uniref:CRTAC1 family protein n=1 Tax=Paenibacillus sp. SYP-B4298 TaxID=2996034 RepID=UPI0022DDBA1D|nr:CRTAC1 family protein [Paenibacillus sp. SYP-B4298]
MKPYRITLFILLFIVVTILSACGGGTQQDYGFTYNDVTETAGISFVHETSEFDPKLAHMLPWFASTGAGVAVADFDGDGLMDIYFANSKPGSMNALYRNNGDGTFTDVAAEAGVADVNQGGVTQAVLWFDYDNDGFPDLFVGMWGKSRLFHNNRDGTFTDITDQAGAGYQGYVNKVITLDYNKDGHLDLYLGTYFRETDDLWNLTSTKVLYDDFERARNGGRNVLLRNNGDGTFTDVTKELGVDDTGWTLAVGAADLDHDGWPDIYVANDFGPDTLYMNEQGRSFRKVVQSRGIGDDTFKGMNVDFADVFRDGKFVNYVSNITKEKYLLEGNQLWHEDENGVYRDRAEEMGVKQSGFSWGARFFDANNSGNMSLMVTNGFISASKKRDYWFDMGTLATTPGYVVEDARNWPAFKDKSMSGYEQKSLFLNDGKGFTNVAQDVGITFVEDGRGIAAVDLWNRGVLDLVFANQGGQARMYKVNNETGNHWIKLHLIGQAPSNRDAVGARVTFTVKGISTVIERDGGNSHGGQSDPRIHFGLGDSEQVDSIRIEWPSGRVQELHNVKADLQLQIIEETESGSK